MPMNARDAAIAILKNRLDDPLKHYKPIEKQLLAHQHFSDITLLLTGNGFGKTTFGGGEFCAAMTGRHEELFGVKGKYPPPPLDGRICSEKEAIDEKIVPLLHKYLDPYLAKGYPQKKGTSIECKWKLKNGSEFDIKTYKQDDTAFESVDKNIIWFDEPFRESIWVASIARMRKGKGGRILITMTPLLHAAWMYEKWIAVPPPEDKVKTIYAEVWDNCKCLMPEVHDSNSDYSLDREDHCRCHGGYIHKQAIERQLNEYDESERDAREKGLFITLRDKVFTPFDGNVHILPEDLTPEEVAEKNLTLYVAVDPHMRRPPAWGLYGIDADDIVYVLDEFPNIYKGMYKTSPNCAPPYYHTIKNYKRDYAETVRELYEAECYWGGNIKRRFMDPRHGHSRLPNTNEQIIDAYRRAAREQGFDMRFIPASVGSDSNEGEIASGITMINDKLRYDATVDISAGNMPGLYVNPSCANHIHMFNYCKFVTQTGKAAEGKLPSEIIEPKFKDFCDIVRYLFKSIPKRSKRNRNKSEYTYRPANLRTGW
jgi:hypothetical protein